MSLRARLVLLFTLAALGVGVVFGLVLARRLQLGLESDLDGVMRERAAAVAATASGGQSPDLGAAQGPAQLISPTGLVLGHAGGASPRVPLMGPVHRRRAQRGVFIIDAVEPLAGHRAPARVLARPLAGGDLLAIAVDRNPVDDVVDRTGLELALLGTPLTALVALGVWLVAGAALRPVERMRAQAAAAVPGHRTVLTVPRGRDELTRLATTLNDLLAAQQAALRAEQSFLADAGHELRTPLAILAGELELADRPTRTREDLQETVTIAREETARLVRLAEQLLVLARVEGTEPDRVDLDVATLAERALATWTTAAGARGVALRLDAVAGAVARADPDRVRQVIDNLLANALRFAPPGSVVEVGVGPAGPGRGHAAATGVELSVRDHGPGFPEDFLPRAFERFGRADPSRARGGPAGPDGPADGAGTGLGLAVVRRIAESHGGSARAANDPGGGARVTVVLPGRAAPPASGAPGEGSPTAAPASVERW